MRAHLERRNPALRVAGAALDPDEPRPTIAAVVQFTYMALMMFCFFGDALFSMIGIPPPNAYNWVRENKLTAGFMIYFLGNNIVNGLMSTGAFEIMYNGELVWSKMDAGRMPSWPELEERLSNLGALTLGSI